LEKPDSSPPRAVENAGTESNGISKGAIAAQPSSPLPNASFEWIAKFENAPPEVLKNEAIALGAELDRLAAPFLKERFDSGIAELVSTETEYRPTDEEMREVMGVRMRSGRGTWRAVLPRNEFPELYEIKDKILWLHDLYDQRVHEEDSTPR